ncbi:MAG: flagellar hook protein FlgE [Planctomycetota bacterium]|jgi:flagellar hook protein FlgE
MAVSALAAGISGLKISQAALNVIGDNLANLNTPGFKSSRVTFSDELSQTLRPANAPGGGIGGKNPMQSGTGARVSSIDVNYGQGGITPTGRPFDLAIEGEGFFVLTDGSQDFYSRVGAFNLDENNDLVDSATGYKVKATASTINVPTDTVVPAKATANVDLVGNLDSGTTSGAVNQIITTTTAFTAGGAATSATALNSLYLNTVSYVTGDTISVTGSETNGTDVNTTFTYGASNDGTTLGALQTFISASYGSGTATIDGSGNIVVTADAPGSSSLALTLADGASNTGATTWPSLSVTTTGSGSTYVTTVPIFDAQGKSFPVTLTFEKTTANVWGVSATMDPADGSIASLGITSITFNANGSYSSIGGTTAMTITLPDSTSQVVNFNLGTANSFTGLTQLSGNSSAAATSQDGYEAGFFLSVTVNSDGTVDALFTNGQTQTLDQMQLATFTNPAGLEKQGKNLLLPSVASGDAILRLPLTGSTGSIVSGALEGSNVDIAEEFTSMIINQRAFQANARTITTNDEVMQELVNIVR